MGGVSWGAGGGIHHYSIPVWDLGLWTNVKLDFLTWVYYPTASDPAHQSSRSLGSENPTFQLFCFALGLFTCLSASLPLLFSSCLSLPSLPYTPPFPVFPFPSSPFSPPLFPHLSAFLISFEQIVNSFEIFQIHFIQFLSPSCVLMVINMHPCTAFFFKYNLCSSNYTYFMDLSRDFMFVV